MRGIKLFLCFSSFCKYAITFSCFRPMASISGVFPFLSDTLISTLSCVCRTRKYFLYYQNNTGAITLPRVMSMQSSRWSQMGISKLNNVRRMQLDSVSTSVNIDRLTMVDNTSAVGNDSRLWVVPQSINGCQLPRGRDGSLRIQSLVEFLISSGPLCPPI